MSSYIEMLDFKTRDYYLDCIIVLIEGCLPVSFVLLHVIMVNFNKSSPSKICSNISLSFLTIFVFTYRSLLS